MIFARIFSTLILFYSLACAQTALSSRNEKASVKEETGHKVLFGKSTTQFPSSRILELISFCLPQLGDKGFVLEFSKAKIRLVQGELDTLELEACLSKRKEFQWKEAQQHWLWTSNFSAPKEVGKNWIELLQTSKTPPILEKSGFQP